MDDKVAEALRSLGVAEDELAPDVLAGLRKAAAKSPPPLTRGDLARMSAEDVLAAARDGRCDHLIKGDA